MNGASVTTVATSTEPPELSPCQVLQEAACRGVGYENLVLPDAFVHKLPNLASDELLSFLPLLEVRRSGQWMVG